MAASSEFDPDRERGPIAWMAKNPVASNVLMLILILGGLVTLAAGIKQEVFPEVDLDVVLVDVVYPGASPAEVEQAVVLAIEEGIRGVDGIKEVRSTAREGSATVIAEDAPTVSAHRVTSPGSKGSANHAPVLFVAIPESAERAPIQTVAAVPVSTSPPCTCPRKDPHGSSGSP